MSIKLDGCLNCSFYTEEIELANLDQKSQKLFENFDFQSLADESEITDELGKWLLGLQNNTCIGGLLKKGEVKSQCKYCTELPQGLDKNQLIQSFSIKSNRIATKKQIALTLILAIITISVSIFGIFKASENRALKKELGEAKSNIELLNAQINNQKVTQHSDSINFVNLKDSISKLNTLIKIRQK